MSGKDLDPNLPANPCGLVAKSVFTDTFWVTDPNGKNMTINDTDISWASDREYKFKNMITTDGKDWRDL